MLGVKNIFFSSEGINTEYIVNKKKTFKPQKKINTPI